MLISRIILRALKEHSGDPGLEKSAGRRTKRKHKLTPTTKVDGKPVVI